MRSAEFIDLVRRMRQAQQDYYSYRGPDSQHKRNLLITSKQLEKQVDDAVITDPQNLVTDSGLNG